MNKNDHSHLPQSLDVDVENSMERERDNHPISETPNLLSLPPEVLISQLSYIGIQDVEKSVQFTCKALYKLSNAQHLWHEYCQQTGKLKVNTLSDSINNISYHNDQIDYKRLYKLSPCVPIDFPTIMAALHYYTIVKDRLSSSNFTITLMPGVYHEQIKLDANDYQLLLGERSSGSMQRKKHGFIIRAAFRDKGAAIVHYDQNDMNQPCVNIINQSDNYFGNDERYNETPMFNVTFEDIQFLHYTKGNDIWNGNCALQINGNNLNVNISSCSFQSDSGRGIVASRGAQIDMIDTSVHDCAATGIYIGDLNSSANIARCNILRNGGGTRIPTTGIEEDSKNIQSNPLDNIDYEISHQVNDANENDHHLVPPGHSGMYLEASTATVTDCLLSRNSLTGLSVVRGGKTRISRSDIFGNGSDPVTIEDAHDVSLGLGEEIRGGIEDLGGNYFSEGNGEDHRSYVNGTRRHKNYVRKTIFPTSNYDHTTLARLHLFYS